MSSRKSSSINVNSPAPILSRKRWQLVPFLLILDLADIDVFQETKKVIEAFQNKEVGPTLAWCAENKSRLKKSKVCILFFFCVRWWGDLAIIGVVR
ncbi:uncharacterized protein LOC133730176 [Rosa rugosa]|uniref:uncharacterized protein LOC133730176 n=1 Tax=Rosa rugosa TaxID=74645 RepID=UPI002B4073A8|nr:uncharacterized protein LOC133730176 [Rosa rugosa]